MAHNITKESRKRVRSDSGPTEDVKERHFHADINGNAAAGSSIQVNGPIMGNFSYSSASPPLERRNLNRENKQPFIVLHPRAQDYVPRPSIDTKLKMEIRRGDVKQRRLALCGLGGAGKTSIAVNCAYAAGDAGLSVFWVHGNTEGTFRATCTDIIQQTPIATKARKGYADDASLAQLKSWLDSPESGKWLLVLDNVDDLDEFISKVSKFIPQRKGTILFTTRCRHIVAHRGFGIARDGYFDVFDMSDSEALALFYAGMGMDEDDPSDTEGALSDEEKAAVKRLLGRHLENLPLAIAQATAYIRRSGVGILEYLELFESGFEFQEKLLCRAIPRATPYETLESRAVMKTWTVTMNKLTQSCPVAVQILKDMVFSSPYVDWSVIEENHFVREGCRVSAIEEALDARAELLNYALLREDASNCPCINLYFDRYFRIHRLVRLWTRCQMSAEEERQRKEQIMQAYIARNGRIYDDGVEFWLDVEY